VTHSTWDICVRTLVQQKLNSLYVASFHCLKSSSDSLYLGCLCPRFVQQELNSLYVASFLRLNSNGDPLYLGCLCPHPCPAGTEQPLCGLLPPPEQ
jgi:hypothetical protein